MPKSQVIRIPQRIFPFTSLSTRIAVINTPMIASRTQIPASFIVAPSTASSENSCTSVAPPTTIFAFCRPINAIKNPIPTDTAFFRFIGIELKIASLTLNTDSTMKIRPSTNTAARAACHGYPIPMTTVYAKYALSPIPGARANG